MGKGGGQCVKAHRAGMEDIAMLAGWLGKDWLLLTPLVRAAGGPWCLARPFLADISRQSTACSPAGLGNAKGAQPRSQAQCLQRLPPSVSSFPLCPLPHMPGTPGQQPASGPGVFL